MIFTPTRTLLLLCSVALAHTPASAKPSQISGKAIHNVEFTDVSAVRRHHQVMRRHVRSVHVHQPRLRERIALQAEVSAADPFSVGYQSAPSAQLGYRGAPRAHFADREAPNARTRRRSFPVAQAPAFGSPFGSGVVAEARRYIGTNPTGRSSLWCGHFMNLVLERSGRAASNSNTARSFASYGQRVSGPQVGAIAVMSRGRRGGHVGVVSGIDANGNPIIISGNHGGRVAESVYPRGRIFAYVMP